MTMRLARKLEAAALFFAGTVRIFLVRIFWRLRHLADKRDLQDV
jgi:hypothetical protein